MGIAGAAHVCVYAPTQPPIPSPTFAPPQSAALLSCFCYQETLSGSANADSRVGLYPVESPGFVGLTLHEFVGLDAFPIPRLVKSGVDLVIWEMYVVSLEFCTFR